MQLINKYTGEVIDAAPIGAYALPSYLAGDWQILSGSVEEISSIVTTADVIQETAALAQIPVEDVAIQNNVSPALVQAGPVTEGVSMQSNTRVWFWQDGGAYIASIGITDGCSGGNQGACDMAWFAPGGGVTIQHPGQQAQNQDVGDQSAESMLEAYAGERGETLVQVDNESDAWAYISGDTSKAIAGGSISTVLAGIPFPVLLIGGGLILGKLFRGKRR